MMSGRIMMASVHDTSHAGCIPSPASARKASIAEQTIDNGRNAREGLGGHADHRHHLVAPLGILGEVDRRTDAEGHRDEQGHQHHGNGIDDGRHHRGILGGVLPLKQRGLQVGNALDEDIEHQRKQHQDSAGPRQLSPGCAVPLPWDSFHYTYGSTASLVIRSF